jgi:hypothetical protein
VLLLGNDFNNLRGLLGSMPPKVGEKRSISAKKLPAEPLAAKSRDHRFVHQILAARAPRDVGNAQIGQAARTKNPAKKVAEGNNLLCRLSRSSPG